MKLWKLLAALAVPLLAGRPGDVQERNAKAITEASRILPALAELDSRQMESLRCRCCGAAGMDAVFFEEAGGASGALEKAPDLYQRATLRPAQCPCRRRTAQPASDRPGGRRGGRLPRTGALLRAGAASGISLRVAGSAAELRASVAGGAVGNFCEKRKMIRRICRDVEIFFSPSPAPRKTAPTRLLTMCPTFCANSFYQETIRTANKRENKSDAPRDAP